MLLMLGQSIPIASDGDRSAQLSLEALMSSASVVVKLRDTVSNNHRL